MIARTAKGDPRREGSRVGNKESRLEDWSGIESGKTRRTLVHPPAHKAAFVLGPGAKAGCNIRYRPAAPSELAEQQRILPSSARKGIFQCDEVVSDLLHAHNP